MWVFTNFIVVKCGSELKYIKIERADDGHITKYNADPVDFNINLGSEVWVQNIYSTGVDDLVQLIIINDDIKRHYVLTWNLQLNREHSNF